MKLKMVALFETPDDESTTRKEVMTMHSNINIFVFKKVAFCGLLLSFSLMAASSSWAGPIGSFGPPPIDSCSDYVTRAMSQVQMATGCNFPGPRWHPNPNEHKNWCNRSSPRDRGFENDDRQKALMVCRANVGRINIANCGDYTSRAISQIELALKMGCNFPGPRWVQNLIEHMSWCNRSSPDARAVEDEERRKALAGCKVVQGDLPVIH
ncbi:MAG: hypothetical protein ACXWTK_02380 [Methylobacter sp.]